MTHAEVLAAFHYNPATGELLWKIRASTNIKIGSAAGSINRSRGYLYVKWKRKSILAHRLIWFYMTGQWPKLTIDHINRDKLDNRWSNLREVTHALNQHNRNTNCTSRSGCIGVDWFASRKSWRARITTNGKTVHIGYFATKEEAAKAYAAVKERLQLNAT